MEEPLMAPRLTPRTARQLLRTGTVIAAVAAMSCLTAPAHARDPAAVGSSSDPALVGGYSRPAASATSGSSADTFSQAAMQRENSIGDAEKLLAQVRGQLSGTAGSGTREGDAGNAVRYRSEVEAMVRNHWDQLGPLTRDLYSADYGRSNPYDNSQRYRSPYGDNSQMENQLLGATRDVQGAMQSAEDLLLPLLKDLKQGFDNSLQQNAIRR
jgi:hypothetical protein